MVVSSPLLDPQMRFGKPVVKGTRTTVAEMLKMLANGMSTPIAILAFIQSRRGS